MTKDKIKGRALITKSKKKLAVKLVVRYKGNISKVVKKLGIKLSTFYRWINKDKKLREKILQTDLKIADEVRDKLLEEALKGNIAAIIFWLRKRHPDFCDKPQTLLQINYGDEMKLEFIKPEQVPKIETTLEKNIKRLEEQLKNPKDKIRMIRKRGRQ